MKYYEREEIFNKIMVNIRNQLYEIFKLNKHKKYNKYISNNGFIPLLSVNPKTMKYRFNCYCLDCPGNIKGLCATKFDKIPKEMIHEFDTDNIIKNYCG